VASVLLLQPRMSHLKLQNRLNELCPQYRVGSKSRRDPGHTHLFLCPLARGQAGPDCCHQALPEFVVSDKPIEIRRDGANTIRYDARRTFHPSKHDSPQGLNDRQTNRRQSAVCYRAAHDCRTSTVLLGENQSR
jgi:hypothetical protein